MKIKAGYVRLSRDDDKKQYESIIEQKSLITNYYKNFFNYFDEIKFYEDDDESGINFNRSGFQELKNDIYNNKVDTLVIKDLSRLGRKNWETEMYYEKFVDDHEVRIISINDNHDSNNESSRDVMGIFTWSNERYVKDISKKIKTNLNQKQLRGELLISVPYGYTKIENKIIKDDFTSAIISEIYQLYMNGWGYRKISELLNTKNYPTPSSYKNKKNSVSVWNFSMIRDILHNEFYTGTLLQKKTYKKKIKGTSYKTPIDDIIRFEENHEAIINIDTFNLVKQISQNRSQRQVKGTKNNYIHLFAGKIYCFKCGKTFVYKRSYKNKDKNYKCFYLCGTQHKLNSKYCRNKYISEDKLLEIIQTEIKSKISEIDNIFQILKEEINAQSEQVNYQNIANKLKIDIEKKQKMIQKIYIDKLNNNGVIPDYIYDNTLSQVSNELSMLNEQYEKYTNMNKFLNDQKDSLNKQDIKLKQFLNRNLQRQDIEILIDKIIINDNSIEIIFNI